MNRYSLSGTNVELDTLISKLKETTDEATIITMDPETGNLMLASNQSISPMELIGMVSIALDELKNRVAVKSSEEE